MGRRFSRINYARKTLKATSVVIDKYKAFQDGTSLYEVASQPRGRTIRIGLTPFGILTADPASAPIKRAGITTNANTGRTTVGLTDAELGHLAATAVTDNASGFSPAKIIVIKKDLSTKTTPLSKITGLEYAKYTAESWTIPFGVKTTVAASEGELEAQNRLAADVEAVSAGNLIYNVTFKPERQQRR